MIAGIGAQIAFPALGLAVIGTVGGKEGSAWGEGTGLKTEAAANALLFVHDPHVAKVGVRFQCIDWTYLHTGGLDALTALLNRQIIWKGGEGILHDLDPGEREALPTFVDQGTGQHAAQTALAFLDIHQQIPVGGWNQGFGRKNLCWDRRVGWHGCVGFALRLSPKGWRRDIVCRPTAANSGHNHNGPSYFDKVSASNSPVSSLLTIH
jgi:hypothetical protein